MEGKRTTTIQEKGGRIVTTSLLEIVGSVLEAVEGLYPDDEHLVRLVVCRLLAGIQDPEGGARVSRSAGRGLMH